MIDTFIACMKQKGWKIELCETRNNYLPEEIADRYKNIPSLWREFIVTIKEIMCPDETEWFLCVDDFDWRLYRVHTAWHWNEWELISLKSAESDDEWKESITNFWNNHLPIFLSVKDGYAYYAISMKDGSIVRGSEPEFEECKLVAVSFADFLEKLMTDNL